MVFISSAGALGLFIFGSRDLTCAERHESTHMSQTAARTGEENAMFVYFVTMSFFISAGKYI